MSTQKINPGLLELLQEKTLKSIYKLCWCRADSQDTTKAVVEVLEKKYKTTPLYNDNGEFTKFIKIK